MDLYITLSEVIRYTGEITAHIIQRQLSYYMLPSLLCRIWSPLGMMAVVIDPDIVHLCPQRGVRNRLKVIGTDFTREIFRENKRHEHHLRTLTKKLRVI